ncbi:glycosyltransferase family 4 protein [Mucilaginibacter gotjawali]|uniref:Glycosyltransferase involved in cell wall biosynthesis n=1 Tax=Mucilaginibacter gotjawali TaxID=1550579 RepID=A0A839S9G7_9SPHI|nr:glycosyltransferase family 4 protein [Mucilaginibacter gotjawali]MBB3054635.1 glycosyltransferase involved in cell wall biosynthesis [Mucilaginibacter gotjawali]
MKVALITRSTLFTAPGGDTVQVKQTANGLAELGVDAEILLSNQAICYSDYNLLHFFNIIRPADILYHSKKANKPFVVSTILVNYSEYDKNHRKGIGALFSYLPGDSIEYLKTIARWVLGRDHLASLDYTWKGQRKSIIEILGKTSIALPNSESEYRRLQQKYCSKVKYAVIPNGIDPALFKNDPAIKKDKYMVLCVARIEGVKNQLNLIRALNNTRFRLFIIGAPAPNQPGYYRQCREMAANNIAFIDQLPQEDLVAYYGRAKVHVLPSWFETTGLSSIEAAAMSCNIVITDKGDTREYFESDAFYCDPSNPQSILEAVEQASNAPCGEKLQQKILNQYTWKQTAIQTLKAYQLTATP